MTDETPPDPATAGKDLAPPESIKDDDVTHTEPMTDENPDKIAQAVNGFAQMDARKQTCHVWSVTSWRNGENTRHEVNLLEGTCTCDDMAYNNDGSEVCAHIMKANHIAPAVIDTQEAIDFAIHQKMQRLTDVADRLEQAKTEYPAKMADVGETTAQSPEEAVQEAAPEPEVDPDLAADKLQNAFDDVIDDMQVKSHAGRVWFQTGRDTPDDWPFPGAGSTFDAVTSPDVVEYVYESEDGPNHEWYDDKPGEWWKNALNPSDVDTYINEVLN